MLPTVVRLLQTSVGRSPVGAETLGLLVHLVVHWLPPVVLLRLVEDPHVPLQPAALHLESPSPAVSSQPQPLSLDQPQHEDALLRILLQSPPPFCFDISRCALAEPGST